MRVSDSTFYARFLAGLRAQDVKTNDLLASLADGKKVRVASDDPAGAGISLALRSRLARIAGYDRSAQAARTDLATLDGVLGEVFNLLSEARAEAMGGASSAQEGGNEARAVVIERVREELLALANTSQGGRYLFAGTETLTAPFDALGVYTGNDDEADAPIDVQESVGATLSGRRVFLDTEDLFTVLDDLAQALRDNNTDDVGALIPALSRSLDQVGLVRTEVGTRLQRIDGVIERHGDEALRLLTRIGEIEDIDVAEAIVGLQEADTTTTALSSAAARVLGRSLFDYLG